MRKIKVFHVLIIFILFLLIVLLFNFTIKYLREKKKYEPYKKIPKESVKLVINGEYLNYVNLNDKYNELGASLYGNVMDDDVVITYYKNGHQVFSIDTRDAGEYLVKYKYGNVVAYRTVIVCDKNSPIFNEIKTKQITDLEAVIYDVNDDIYATDNSLKVDVSCENSLGFLPGNYSINCKATDFYGNLSVKKRLIKVIEGIKFEYNDNLKIIFPKNSNYIYKYSLDGKSFADCNQICNVDINSGSIIAAVYLNNELIISSTYFIK